MRDAHRNRIGGIGWRGDCEPKERANHKGYLGLLRGSDADNRLLHPTRRILVDRQSPLRSCQQNSSPSGSESDRRGKALHINDALDGHRIGCEFFHGIAQPGVNFEKATGYRELGGIFDDIKMQASHLSSCTLQHGKARSSKGRIHG